MSAVQDHVVPAIPKIRDNTAQMNQSLQNLESQTSGHLAALKHDSANILGVMQESNQNILSALSQIVQHSAAGNSSAEQRSTQISTKIEALSSQAQQTYQMLETHMQSILQGVSQANGNAENTKNILGQYFENLAKVIEKSSSEQKEILQQIEQKGSETTRIEKTLLQLEKALFDMRRKLSDVEGLGQKMVQKLSKTPQDKQDKNVDDV
jgi:chromosome segregation ATPase